MPTGTGAFTSTFDVAELALYAFFLFFLGLVFYLRREDKREGYPLESDRSDRTSRVQVQGFPFPPGPKKLHLFHEPDELLDRRERDLTGILAPAERWPGAPFVPLGDPMQDGVGSASYAQRSDVPDLTFDEQLPKIVPLRVATSYYLAPEDPDPRGMEVVGADGIVAGTVSDVWIDRSETFIRLLEVDVAPFLGVPQRHVLVPTQLVRIDVRRRRVTVKSTLARQIAAAPTVKNPDQITLLEEDRIAGYFAGGHLYATPKRLGPVL
jgi:photosynthetic reaction center H subunit